MTVFSDQQCNILLSVSTDIANIKGKEELVHLINHRIKPLLGFTGFSIFTFNNPEKVSENFISDPGDNLRRHPDYNSFITTGSTVKWEVLLGSAEDQGPIVLDLEDSPLGLGRWEVKIFRDSGITQVVCVVLQQAGEKFGVMKFYLEKPLDPDSGILTLVWGAVNQIAVAVSNIAYLEEIRQREEEKTILLSFSSSMAAVRAKHELNVIIGDQLKKLCNIRDYVISVIHPDGKTHGGFIYNLDAHYIKMPEFTKALNTRFDINDGVFEVFMVSDKPFIFNIAALLTRKDVPGYIRFWHEIGIRTVIGVALTHCGEPIGVLWVEPDKADTFDVFYSSLFGGTVAQLSIALSNILANEKIENQLKEIDGYRLKLLEEKSYLQNEIGTDYNHSEIIGLGEEMAEVFLMVSQVSPTDSTVLLLGETGTGKELIARAIHGSSKRKEKLMIKVNCAALPANLIESELFGHEKGSFTGAMERRTGKFELAHQGTIFLDEVGEMPMDLQVKLLRVLQEREIERIGGRATIKIDVRVIAATNRDLLNEVAKGTFRSDLYYRLNVFPITLPPLRHRKGDIHGLANFFIEKFAKKNGKKVDTITPRVLQDLMDYHWPGNVRELEHLMERSVLLSQGPTIKDIQFCIPQNRGNAKKNGNDNIKTIDENEREHILNVLNKCGGKVFGPYGAAVKLGVPVSTLNSKIARLGIVKEKIVSVERDKTN
jgi:formate hydrogenlyase transcriptional activator